MADFAHARSRLAPVYMAIRLGLAEVHGTDRDENNGIGET
jgi:hypothetical protein